MAIGRFHKKKHRCRGAICATCLAGGKEERIWNGITILRMEGRKEGRRGPGGIRRSHVSEEPILHFHRTPPCILFLGTPGVRDAPLSPRCRSRHLLLALFFAATRHLHNYNLASAVSKTRAPGPSPSVSGPVVVVVVVVVKRGGGKKRTERKEE